MKNVDFGESRSETKSAAGMSFVVTNHSRLKPVALRAKLYPLQRTVSSRKCSKKRCKVCENVQNSDIFRSSVTFETFKLTID